MKYSIYLAGMILATLMPDPLVAASGIGDPANEFWVDGPLDVKLGPSPSFPDAAVDHRGRSIFVWDEATFSPSIQAHNIVMRVFDRNGQSLVGPVKINTYDDNSQLNPRVAVSADGSFLVIWQSFELPEGQAANRIVVRSQAFDSDAQLLGSEQIVSSLNTLKAVDVSADVAALTGGGYVAVWQSGQSPDTTHSTSIQARRIGSNGVPLLNQFQVNNTASTTPVTYSTVTQLQDGGFFVAWTFPEIRGRRFAADGTPVAADFQLNTLTAGNEAELDLATHQDGRVMLVWRDSGEPTGEGNEIRGRLFSATAVAQGDDFRINSSTAGSQSWPSVADYAGNGFFVTWQSPVSTGGDSDPDGIEARVVRGINDFPGPQFQVNTYTTESQFQPSVGGKAGRIATVWISARNTETSQIVVVGRGWSICGIFCDGFEGD
ncbi:MAG TPA: hypothetical protein VFG52_07645 [Xanthomonadales bacterium]|nr:hypothetical protein [Xanthomonadales bacterium]